MKRSGSRLLAALYYRNFKYSPHNAKEKIIISSISILRWTECM
ncbi:MAG: hypothetical protein ACTTGX_06635 [Candidatus Cryptobacteroides sp.]